MSKSKTTTIYILVIMLLGMGCFGERVIDLPAPSFDGDVCVEEALQQRRSRRSFADESLSIEQTAQILWAAYGVSLDERQFHTAPSAGATFPSEIFLFARDVDGLDAGIYHYIPKNHTIEQVKKGDLSTELQEICLGQGWIGDAQANVIIAAEFERTTKHYGDRGNQYVYQESGHIGQNIYLQAQALGLGTVAIGAFDENRLKELMEIEFRPIYIFPIGNLER